MTIPNFYSDLVKDQKIACVDSFVLESGITLFEVPVAYKTWGRLNEKCDNCLVICHALSGSSDVEDWWGPLLGPGKAFDSSRYFIVCANMMGSPYGSASPLSTNPQTRRPYGPDFPQTTVRDDVRLVLKSVISGIDLLTSRSLHKLLLDSLGIRGVAAVVGGSMGGMSVLEWALCTPKGYVKAIIPIATSIDQSAWGISWAEIQRQCIFADFTFNDGYYDPVPETQPKSGLSAARMIAMLTYRSCQSFDKRFARKPATPPKSRPPFSSGENGLISPPYTPERETAPQNPMITQSKREPLFSAQSYLQYQGQKFLSRFDANCYIHLTRKMDLHDVAYNRIERLSDELSNKKSLRQLFKDTPRGALVVGVESDVLFPPQQQKLLADILPGAELRMLASLDGHDGFLLEIEALGSLITQNLKQRCPWIYKAESSALDEICYGVKDSVFGEIESGW